MEIKFEWHSTNQNVNRNEIENIMERAIEEQKLKKPSRKLLIRLYDRPSSQILTGSAVNEKDEEVIKINYRLQGNTLVIPNLIYDYC